jgi:hypothetical protein
MSADLATTLREREERLLLPAVRADRAALLALMAEDLREIGASGIVYDRAALIAAVLAQAPRMSTLSDFAARALADDIALATYRVDSRDDASGARTASLRSSLWRREDGHWRLFFHQGTPLPDPAR